MTLIISPSFTLISGPGTRPLYVQAQKSYPEPRFTLALEAGQISLARYLARPLGQPERDRIERWAKMQSDPDGRLSRPDAFGDSEDDRRLVAYGFGRLVRRDPLRAEALLPEYVGAPLTATDAASMR